MNGSHFFGTDAGHEASICIFEVGWTMNMFIHQESRGVHINVRNFRIEWSEINAGSFSAFCITWLGSNTWVIITWAGGVSGTCVRLGYCSCWMRDDLNFAREKYMWNCSDLLVPPLLKHECRQLRIQTQPSSESKGREPEPSSNKPLSLDHHWVYQHVRGSFPTDVKRKEFHIPTLCVVLHAPMIEFHSRVGSYLRSSPCNRLCAHKQMAFIHEQGLKHVIGFADIKNLQRIQPLISDSSTFKPEALIGWSPGEECIPHIPTKLKLVYISQRCHSADDTWWFPSEKPLGMYG